QPTAAAPTPSAPTPHVLAAAAAKGTVATTALTPWAPPRSSSTCLPNSSRGQRARASRIPSTSRWGAK
ncbi:unnamed protein product, partial [Prorocentrum cordatum]